LPARAIERFTNVIFSKGHVMDGDELTLSLSIHEDRIEGFLAT
jgi:hypothetical protein